MGASDSSISHEELQEYADLTFFSKKEIVYAFERFTELDPDAVNKDKKCRIPQEIVCQMPELKVNPFRDRICRVFSSSEACDGSFSFDDFLDMMNVFSDDAPTELKAEYAFKIYDMNEDDLLDVEDIEAVVSLLTGGAEGLTNEDMRQLIKNILAEADLDDDEQLSYAEFEHVITKSPEFLNSFRMRL